MIEQTLLRLWLMRLCFLTLSVLIVMSHLLPLETTPRNWAFADLLIGFALAWSVRRPEYVPAVLLAAVFMLSDLLQQRPPGLWAVLSLGACEWIKAQSRNLRDANFLTEWTNVALLLIAITLAYRIILSLTISDVPSFGLSFMQMILTIALYPLCVVISHSLLSVRKSAPGDMHMRGSRL